MLKPNRKPVEAAVGGLLLLISLAWPGPVQAGINDVPNKVQEGIEHYEAGQFDKAVEAFEAAREKQPKDTRLLFDAACAKAAAGKTDEAVQLFQQAAVTPDAELAAKCHYNLGRLAAERAKAALGEKPEAAEEKARNEARELAEAAIAHWRDCLASKPEHADAQYNLELTRLWRDRMDHAWKEADRQKRLAKMKLPEMLKWLETEQQGLRGKTQSLSGREPSPLHRLAVHQTAGNQRDLCQDIDPLKQKIAQAINQPQMPQGVGSGAAMPMGPAPPMGAAPGGTCTAPGMCGSQAGNEFAAMDPKQREQAIKVLSTLADQAEESMRTAAEHITEHSPTDARGVQGTAIEHLDQINTVVTPYPDLVFRAVDRQKQLVGKPSPAAVDASLDETGDLPANEDDQDVPAARSDDSTLDKEPAEAKRDLSEEAWRQRFVERWVPIIMAKAKQGLAAMPPAEPERPKKEADKSTKPDAADAPPVADADSPEAKHEKGTPPTDAKPDPEEEARKQRENLRKSMELALKLGPDVQRLVTRAAADLGADRPDEALPRQQEALKLLEKIAEPLKKPNKNQQNQNQQNQQNQDKKDQNKDQNKDKKNKDKDKKNKDQQNKDDKKDKKDQKQGQDKKDQKNQQKDQKSKSGQAQRQPRELSKQQAKALLERVRQRDREKEKARKAMMEAISRPPQAEKDW